MSKKNITQNTITNSINNIDRKIKRLINEKEERLKKKNIFRVHKKKVQQINSEIKKLLNKKIEYLSLLNKYSLNSAPKISHQTTVLKDPSTFRNVNILPLNNNTINSINTINLSTDIINIDFTKFKNDINQESKNFFKLFFSNNYNSDNISLVDNTEKILEKIMFSLMVWTTDFYKNLQLVYHNSNYNSNTSLNVNMNNLLNNVSNGELIQDRDKRFIKEKITNLKNTNFLGINDSLFDYDYLFDIVDNKFRKKDFIILIEIFFKCWEKHIINHYNYNKLYEKNFTIAGLSYDLKHMNPLRENKEYLDSSIFSSTYKLRVTNHFALGKTLKIFQNYFKNTIDITCFNVFDEVEILNRQDVYYKVRNTGKNKIKATINSITEERTFQNIILFLIDESKNNIDHLLNTSSDIIDKMKQNEKKKIKKKIFSKTIELVPYAGKVVTSIIDITRLYKNYKVNFSKPENFLNQILLYLYLQTRSNFISLKEIIHNTHINNTKISKVDLEQSFNKFEILFKSNNSSELTKTLSATSSALINLYKQEKKTEIEKKILKNIPMNLISQFDKTEITKTVVDIGILFTELKMSDNIDNTLFIKNIKQCLKNKSEIQQIIYLERKNMNMNANVLTKQTSRTSSNLINNYKKKYKSNIRSEVLHDIIELIPGISVLKSTYSLKKNINKFINEIKNIDNLSDITMKTLLLNRFICKVIKNVFNPNNVCIGDNIKTSPNQPLDNSFNDN